MQREKSFIEKVMPPITNYRESLCYVHAGYREERESLCHEPASYRVQSGHREILYSVKEKKIAVRSSWTFSHLVFRDQKVFKSC